MVDYELFLVQKPNVIFSPLQSGFPLLTLCFQRQMTLPRPLQLAIGVSHIISCEIGIP